MNEVYVVPEFQRKGTRKTVMIYAHSWFEEKGINTIRVEIAASYKKLSCSTKNLVSNPITSLYRKKIIEKGRLIPTWIIFQSKFLEFSK